MAQQPATPAPAAPPAAAAPAPATPSAPADPVLAKVNGDPIRLSDVQEAAQSLPQARSMPPQQLLPVMLEQLIDAKALLLKAQAAGLDKDPEVQKAIKAAQERALESAYLTHTIRPQVSDEAVKAKYDAEYANKPGEEEIHARHILVPDEATAKKIIAQLQKGADFAKLSSQYSKDPGAAQQGGDLGFFKKGDMVPEFSDVAFSLKDNEISPTPVKTQFGYHVIQVLGRRTAPPPPFDQVKDQIRQGMVQAAIQKEVEDAKQGVTVERFNPDGSPVKATDSAEPPPAAK
jgi:peptidyl-prolyl cis-trans isomerase C